MHAIVKKTGKIFLNNSLFIGQLCLMGSIAFSPEIAMASQSASMPWSQGVNAISSEITGPLAGIGTTVAIAGAAFGWMQGDSQISKTATKGCIGAGIAMNAPLMVQVLSGRDVQGALF